MTLPAAAQALDVARYYAGTSALLPEILIGVGSAAVLLLDAFAKKGSGDRRPAYITLGILAAALLATLMVGGESVTLFSGMVVIDPFAQFFRVFFLIAGMLGVVIALHSEELGDRNTGEYYSMYLGLIAGMMFMAEASDIVMVYLSLEIVSLMSYVLAGFRRHDRKSAEAALKYVIYGGAASGVMLFGLSLVYGLTGHSQLSMINESVATMARGVLRGQIGGDAVIMPVALTAAIVLSFAGFAYKIAAVPLHMWSPDVYEGAPTPFTAFLSTGPKAAGFAALIRFFVVGFSDASASPTTNMLHEISTIQWPTLIIVVSIATMLLGNLAAIGQNNVKRFLAYSSIAHAGYSLAGLAAFSKDGAASVLIYMVFYLAMNIGAFYAAIWVKENLGSELINDYKGLGHRAPLVCVSMAVCLFSLTGLPPLAGFIGKYYLFASVLNRAQAMPLVSACAPSALEASNVFQHVSCLFLGSGALYTLALVGVLNSAVSLYYYARIVRNMFLEQPEDPTPIEVDLGAKLVLVPISMFLLIFGIYWAPLESAAKHAIEFRRPTLAEITGGPTPSVAKESETVAPVRATAQADDDTN